MYLIKEKCKYMKKKIESVPIILLLNLLFLPQDSRTLTLTHEP